MDLKKRLELGHSETQTCEMVEYVSGKPKLFKELVEVYLKGPYRLTQRAAAPLTLCVEQWPYLIDPHIQTLLKYLEQPNVHPAIVRNTVRLFQLIDIPKRYQGRLADLCFKYLLDVNEAIAIRVYAMTVLGHISRGRPDMERELKIILEDHLPYGSPGFRSRALKILQAMKSIK